MKMALWHRLFRPSEKGQVLIIVAVAFIALLILVGLVTDAAVLYVNYTHLRQAVDAGAVAAAAQYRKDRGIEDMYAAAVDVVQLQLSSVVTDVETYWCPVTGEGDMIKNYAGKDYQPYASDLCTVPPRKLVRVRACFNVELFFLPILGINNIPLCAQAEAEAALINVVLLLDTSESMAYGTGPGDPNACPPWGYPRVAGPNHEEFESFADCLHACLDEQWCSPFEDVRAAAAGFVGMMRDGVDSAAVYHFDKTPVLTQSVDLSYGEPITIYPSSGLVVPLTSTLSIVDEAINDNSRLHVFARPKRPDEDDLALNFRWTNTNIGGGLREATDELVRNGTPDAVWVIVLLTDGAANTTDVAADENGWWTCPSPPGSGGPDERTVSPMCRDPEAPDADPTHPVTTTVTRHCPSLEACSNPEAVPWYTNRYLTATHPITYYYDADDYARDMADAAASHGIVLFTIGFGRSVIDYPAGRDDAGERLLRYIADVGDDGDRSTAPCGSDFYWDSDYKWPLPPQGEDCGNYYYADEPDELDDVFEAIAKRVFLRITK
ncbi:MAG: hypothetical protein DRI80_19025 [Chloroflexota bacterium]|nr:MAG: hypothetical protein DRI80_19025 [Chloroflexota bacterium]